MNIVNIDIIIIVEIGIIYVINITIISNNAQIPWPEHIRPKYDIIGSIIIELTKPILTQRLYVFLSVLNSK